VIGMMRSDLRRERYRLSVTSAWRRAAAGDENQHISSGDVSIATSKSHAEVIYSAGSAASELASARSIMPSTSHPSAAARSLFS
jgi:hypothetical protein